MRKILLAFAVSGLSLAAGGAFAADAQYTPDQVVSALLKSADLGATRGICVGTAAECDQAAKPQGFDVMVNFDKNSATLRDDAIVNLKQVATALADPRLGAAKFAIEGFTDASGSDTYNRTLSEERATSVASYLVSQGIPSERIVALGKGEAAPRVPDPYDPVNRRVEMRIDIQ